MKFAIINDTHLGPPDSGFFRGVQRKLVGESERLIKEFVEKMNDYEKPLFVVNLGDSIEDVNDKQIDVVNFKKVIDLLSALRMPLYWLVGNHDVRTLSQDEVAALVGQKRMYFSFDNSGFHFVVLSFEMTGNHTINLGNIEARIPPEQLKWLKQDLANTKLETVVFVHYGAGEVDTSKNTWFEGHPEKAILSNRKVLRRILENSGKVRGVINAHQHWNKMAVHKGIPYFTVTSLVENFKDDGTPAEAYSIVKLDDSVIKVDVAGNDPAHFEFKKC